MPVTSGTVLTYGVTGIREDLANYISNVDAHETPFQSMIGTESVSNTYSEWQIDTLRAATANNAYQEGAEYTYSVPSTTTRVGNHTQIMRESVIVSGTTEAVDKAGRAKELARLVTKKGVELKTDRETILLNNQASSGATSTTARTMGGFPAWLTSNDKRGVGGADGGFNAGTKVVDAADDATTGDLRSYTETLLKDMLQTTYENTKMPKYLFHAPYHKRVFSGFPGISDLRHNADGSGSKMGQAKIIAGADQYLSDWGLLTVFVDRYQRPREVFAVNPQYVSRGVLRPLKLESPSKTGDAEKRVMICEETLMVKNEKAHGVIADLLSA